MLSVWILSIICAVSSVEKAVVLSFVQPAHKTTIATTTTGNHRMPMNHSPRINLPIVFPACHASSSVTLVVLAQDDIAKMLATVKKRHNDE